MTYPVAQFARGDTFTAGAEAFDVQIEGVPVLDMTGFIGAAKVRFSDGSSVALTFTWVDEAQRLYKVAEISPTGAWPQGRAHILAQFTTPAGQKVSARPAPFDVLSGFGDA